MSWAGRTTPEMESVETVDLAAWERDADVGDEFYLYGLDESSYARTSAGGRPAAGLASTGAQATAPGNAARRSVETRDEGNGGVSPREGLATGEGGNPVAAAGASLSRSSVDHEELVRTTGALT